jgi:hypothetical protein
MKNKFIILISLILICATGILGQTDNSANGNVSSQNREIEMEKRLRADVERSKYIYIAKVTRRLLMGYLVHFPDRRTGQYRDEPIFSNRMLIEKNLKGATEKLISLEDSNFKKGARYLIFAKNDYSFIYAINLGESTKELEIVERILAENK